MTDMRHFVLVHPARWHYPAQNKMAVLLFNQQQCEKYATLLHVVVNNVLDLAVDILNICEFKVTNTRMG
jgi:hypothetical protein